MKTQNNNSTKRTLKIVLGVLALLLAIPFCLGMYAGYTSHTGATGQIEKILTEQCNCESVELDLSAYGLQFSRKDGVTGEKVAYILEGCDFNNDIATEAARLNSVLNAEVHDYLDLDTVELNFINGDQTERIVIKNGELQNQ